MIDTAMGALRATVAKALGLSGRVKEIGSPEGLTFADNASAIMVAGSPGRRVAGSPGRPILRPFAGHERSRMAASAGPAALPA